jgi:uncharacterized protein (TIGR03546 family)
MIIRKLGSILRGAATPFQLMSACLLGGLLGFAPGFIQAPALYALLVAGLLILNATLGVALLVAALGRILSLLVLPVSFEVGRFLLDGPASGLARAAVNAPVLAWCGLEYYAVAGGQVLGLFFGLVLGLLVTRIVGSFRRRMAAAQGNPSRMREIAAKPWAGAAMWLFFGKTGKASWEQKLARKVGNPVRIWGTVLVALAVAGAWFAHRDLAGPMARKAVQSGLEAANGATADVGSVLIDLAAGRFEMGGLALADANALERDILRSSRLEADIVQTDLLRKRVHLARLALSDAQSGVPRETPGELTERPPEPEPDAGAGRPDLSDYSLEQVLKDVETWKARLAQARRWMERLAASRSKGAPGDEGYQERLERAAREGGWLSVRANHLIEDTPAFRVSELLVEGLQATWLPGQVLDVRGRDLSTNPALVDEPPSLEVASRDGSIHFEIDLAPASRSGGAGAIRMSWKGLSVDEAMAQLQLPGRAPLSGGTLDLDLDGAWSQGQVGEIDLPLRATFRNTLVAIEGLEPQKVDQLVVPIGLKGPIDAPGIQFDAGVFADALSKAGKDELARRLRGKLEEELGDDVGKKLEDKLGVKLPGDLGSEAQKKAEDLLRSFGQKKPGG